MSDALVLYGAARLAESGVHPDLLSRLTPRQAAEIYGHPRDSDGRLVPPRAADRPASFEEDVARAELVLSAFGVSAQERSKAVEEIRRRHGRSDPAGARPDPAGA